MSSKKLQILGGFPKPDWDEVDESSISYIKNKPKIATDNEIIDMLVDEDMLFAIVDSDGSILVDENENILTW